MLSTHCPIQQVKLLAASATAVIYRPDRFLVYWIGVRAKASEIRCEEIGSLFLRVVVV
jgi:hypothetical protein